MRATRLRSLGLAIGLALVVLLATRQLGCRGCYQQSGAYRAQVDAFLAGRLALTTSVEGLAHDLAWTPSGVQQVWGLGVPAWQTPFELAARAIGQGPFPDRVALLVWIGLAWFVLLRAFRRADEPWWIGAGSVLITALLPGFIAMLRGRVGIYEEAAAYAYTAALVLLGGLVTLGKNPTRGRYLVLVAAAGLTGFLRPTVWFYGLATALLASAVYVQAHGRRAVATLAIGAGLFIAGGAVLYATNAERFGAGGEFGHRLNLESLPGNVMATRFGYPFEHAGWGEGAVELAGAMFGRPERTVTREFHASELHVGQSERPRWREFYFTTYGWEYVPVIIAGLVLGGLAWRRRGRNDSDPLARWLVLWAVLGAAPLTAFYVHSPSLSSRYLLDLGPAIAVLIVIAWRTGARWMQEHERGTIAGAVLVLVWTVEVLLGNARPRVAADVLDRGAATVARDKLSRAQHTAEPLPAAYTLGDPQLERGLDPAHLYINGSGWDHTTGLVPPATHFFIEDPQFVEVEVEPAEAYVRMALGLAHLEVVDRRTRGNRATLRFALPGGASQLRGIHTVFIAFGPDEGLARTHTDVSLHVLRWREH